MSITRVGRSAVIAAVASVGLAGFVASPAQAASALQITRVYVNAPGTDTTANTSVNGEYVWVKNTGTKAISLTNYTLRDQSSHIYKFGSFTLGAGKTVTVRTGKGTNTSTTRYMGRSWHIWNNSGGDSATLRNAAGTWLDKCSWTTYVASYKNC